MFHGEYQGGESALHFAVRSASDPPSDVWTLLVQREETLNIINNKNRDGQTALDKAVKYKKELAIVSLLSVPGIQIGKSQAKLEELARYLDYSRTVTRGLCMFV